MNTACSPCVTTTTQPTPQRAVSTWAGAARTWWARWKAVRQTRRALSELPTLDGLSAESLKDIGAPEWVYEQAYRTQERARQGSLFERDTLHWR